MKSGMSETASGCALVNACYVSQCASEFLVGVADLCVIGLCVIGLCVTDCFGHSCATGLVREQVIFPRLVSIPPHL